MLEVWTEVRVGEGSREVEEELRDAFESYSDRPDPVTGEAPLIELVALEVFSLPDAVVEEAVRAARAFLAAERAGRGAAILDGKMHDRANDRVHRVALETAFALGRLDEETAKELGLS